VGQRGHSKNRELYFFYGTENEDRQLRTGFFVLHRIVSAARTVQFVSDVDR
jgi:hypothetical protein